MATEPVPITMTMSEDDAVEVNFIEGSRIQISPCGANFLYTPPYGSYRNSSAHQELNNIASHSQSRLMHPLYAASGIHQRTCFATSQYHHVVNVALDFRNRFAQRPFLFPPSPHGTEMPLELYADITKAQWPAASDEYNFEQQPDGSIHLDSIDSLATLALSPCAQDFSIRYLCKLQPDKYSVANSTTKTHGSISDLQPNNSRITQPNCSGIPVTRKEDHAQARIGYSPQETPHLKEGWGRSSEAHFQTVNGGKATNPKTSTHDINSAEGFQRSSPVKRINFDDVGHSCSSNPSTKQSSRCKFRYMWVTQSYSVTHCPPFLRKPVELLLEHHRNIQERVRKRLQGDDHGDVEVVSCRAQKGQMQDKVNAAKKSMSSRLPSSLPISCENSHLHKYHWRRHNEAFSSEEERDSLSMYGRKLKVMVASGVVYRLFWETTPSIEIYPGDGSVLKSCDDRGSYFNIFRVDSKGLVEEKIISSAAPPPDTSASKFSVGDLIRRGSRFLQCMGVHQRMIAKESNVCCWKKLDDEYTDPGNLVEQTSIQGIGLLEAYSSGLVKGYFCDGVTMEMKDALLLHTEGTLFNQAKENSRPVCQIHLADGKVTEINISNPGSYSRYITVLQDWAARLRTAPEELTGCEKPGVPEF